MNLFCQSITTKNGTGGGSSYFEPDNLTSVNFTNLRSLQGSGNFEWLLKDDGVSVEIQGAYRGDGDDVGDVLTFTMPTNHDLTQDFNVKVVGTGRSINTFSNSTGQTYSINNAEIWQPSQNVYEMKIYWRTIGNIQDPVVDTKHFSFILSYKK